MTKPNAQTILRRVGRLRSMIFYTVGLCAVVLVAVLAFLPIDERVLATGKIRAEDDTYLHSPEDGVIDIIHFHEGDAVAEGDPIVTLDSTAHRQRLQMVEAAIQRASAELDLQKLKLDRTVKLPLPKEFWHMQEELAGAKERLRQSEVEEARGRELHEKGLASLQELERSQLAAELTRSEVAKVQEKIEVLAQGLEGSILEEARAVIATVQSTLHEIEVERGVIAENIERCILRAPRDGVLTFLDKRRQGQRVSKGEDLAHLSHGPATRVDLFTGETQVHRIRPGQRVVMRSQAFDSLRHGYIEGRILRVPMEPEPLETEAGTRTFRFLAEIEHTPIDLLLGSTVEARIILQRMPLWKLLLPQELREAD